MAINIRWKQYRFQQHPTCHIVFISRLTWWYLASVPFRNDNYFILLLQHFLLAATAAVTFAAGRFITRRSGHRTAWRKDAPGRIFRNRCTRRLVGREAFCFGAMWPACGDGREWRGGRQGRWGQRERQRVPKINEPPDLPARLLLAQLPQPRTSGRCMSTTFRVHASHTVFFAYNRCALLSNSYNTGIPRHWHVFIRVHSNIIYYKCVWKVYVCVYFNSM